jgi:hypothetical protein
MENVLVLKSCDGLEGAVFAGIDWHAGAFQICRGQSRRGVNLVEEATSTIASMTEYMFR